MTHENYLHSLSPPSCGIVRTVLHVSMTTESGIGIVILLNNSQYYFNNKNCSCCFDGINLRESNNTSLKK